MTDALSKSSATCAKLVEDLRILGVEQGDVLVVHASYRAVRPVEGGPIGVIKALLQALGPEGTLVMPSMSDWDDDEVFDPKMMPCLGMGIIADTFWRTPGVMRSDSPHSFAAFGPLAGAITAPHPPEIPHGLNSPVGRVFDLDGRVLLLGVDHDANTTIHLAEAVAQVPYGIPKHVTVLREGRPVRVDYRETDHCCRNFRLAGAWLAQRGLERRGKVGNAESRLMRSRDLVEIVVEELKREPLRFLCSRASGCNECRRARASVAEQSAE